MSAQTTIDPAYGPQYSKDDVFTAKARLHQSRFRLERLGLAVYRDYGNRLTAQHALEGYNFYRAWPGLLELVHARFGRKDSPLYYDMLRSQHIPFNFFGPLALDAAGALAHKLVKWIAPEATRVLAIRIEHAPQPAKALLGDNTAFDVFVEYAADDNERCALGIEVKYTEGPYGYGKRERELMFSADSAYHRLSGNDTYVANAIPRLRQRDLKQLWRNHLLGKATNLYRFRSVLLYPRGNLHAERAVRAYRSSLLPERQHEFVAVTFEDWLSFALRSAHERAEVDWVEYLGARYDIALVRHGVT